MTPAEQIAALRELVERQQKELSDLMETNAKLFAALGIPKAPAKKAKEKRY